MGVTADGWLDWAIRLPGPLDRNLNAGINPVRGIFMHSAEGYAGTLLDPNSQWGYRGNHSWHLTNCMDGRVFQHYPFTARCHHATAANNSYVGVENEGLDPDNGGREPSLNQLQINNAVRFTRDIADWKGWTPSRTGTTAQTLWEHREVVLLGGSSSECPSGRIPWAAILAGLQTPTPSPTPPPIPEEDEMKSWRSWAPWFETNEQGQPVGRQIGPGESIYVVQARSDFQLPPDAAAVLFQADLRSGDVEFFHGGLDTPAFAAGKNAWVANLDERGTINMRTRVGVHFKRLYCVGYYR